MINLKTSCCVCLIILMIGSIPTAETNAQVVDLATVNEAAEKHMEAAKKSRPDIFMLAMRESVQKDILLVESQIKQLKTINETFESRVQDTIESFRSRLSDVEKGITSIDQNLVLDINREVKALRDEMRVEMEKVLLPHQLRRINEIATHIHMQRAGEVAAMMDPSIADELGITVEQKTNLEKRAVEISKKLAEDIQKLKEKAREDLLSGLNETQRKRLKELMGEKFEYAEEDNKPIIRKLNK